ncbi:hypothetical protein K3495_g7075 [Podosphaera aphanis]|nr:hypothetical protein K3495_g7075 [Podosphaera aphanis]
MTHQVVSQQELMDFHSMHFSSTCIDHFSTHFLWPVEEETVEVDSLGYYADGTKRTLTDEQIAIFRHSELQRIKLAQQNLSEISENDTRKDKLSVNSEKPGSDSTLVKPLTNKARKAQKAKLKGYFRQNVKPDLRKRTWDKVDTGLESLDYDELNGKSELGHAQSAQRRKISYDDT